MRPQDSESQSKVVGPEPQYLDEFTSLLVPDDTRVLVDLLKLAVSVRAGDKGREVLSAVLSGMGTAYPQVCDAEFQSSGHVSHSVLSFLSLLLSFFSFFLYFIFSLWVSTCFLLPCHTCPCLVSVLLVFLYYLSIIHLCLSLSFLICPSHQCSFNTLYSMYLCAVLTIEFMLCVCVCVCVCVRV